MFERVVVSVTTVKKKKSHAEKNIACSMAMADVGMVQSGRVLSQWEM